MANHWFENNWAIILVRESTLIGVTSSLGEVTIPFYEDNLIVQLGENGEIYIALRPIVEALGLDWSAQLRRIKRDAVLSKHIRILSVAVTTTEGRNPQHG